jgi:hypothetical protein
VIVVITRYVRDALLLNLRIPFLLHPSSSRAPLVVRSDVSVPSAV